MLYDLPLLTDRQYCSFLAGNLPAIHSMQITMFQGQRFDNRLQSQEGLSSDQIQAALKTLSGPKRYGLLNSRFYEPGTYEGRTLLERIGKTLVDLVARNCLDGIIVSDFYLLEALSDALPDTAHRLEAVPSVNCMLDTFDKVRSCLDLIDATHFQQPGKIILDRSLNRNPTLLTTTAEQLKKNLPQLKLELLANEGCLYQCPFKLSHDAHIAYVNIGGSCDTFRLNSRLGCIGVLDKQPEQLFKSPFIRPEDVYRYEGLIDIIKICGRTLGAAFLQRAVTAYINGSFAGNLLALTDTMEWLANRLFIDNRLIPDTFFDQLTGCTRQCGRCSYCKELFARVAKHLPLHLSDLR